MLGNSARRIRRPVLLRLAFVLAALFAVFILCELGFRLVERIQLARAGELWALNDPDLGWIPNPRYGDHNALGLHDRPVSEKNGRTRILFLGDSVLYYGDSVDDTVVGRLRTDLERAIGPQAIDVVNAGVKGYTNWQELQFLKLHGLGLDPDLVGVGFVLNDCHRRLHQFRVEDGRIVGPSYEFSEEAIGHESWPKRRLRQSRFLVWLRHRFAELEPLASGEFTFDHRPDFRSAWLDEPWISIESQLREMIDLGQEKGFRVFLVAFPFGDQYRPDYLARDRDHVLKPQRKLAEICARLKIPCLDLYALLDPNADLDEDRIHLTASGREKSASRIAAFLQENELLPEAMNQRTIAGWVGVAAFLLLAPGAFFGLPSGKIVVGATRILSGEVPYRDFWTMYAPGSFYAIASLFAVFGRELVVQGLASCALSAAASAVLFALLRDAGVGQRLSIAGAILLALARWHTGVEFTAYEPALLLALLAWRDILASRHLRAGLLLGTAAIFKHDFAAYAAVGSAMALAVRRENPLPLLASGLAVLVPAIPLLAWGAGPDAWRDLVVFPATDFPLVRGEYYPHFVPHARPLVAWVSNPAGLGEIRDAALTIGRYLGCFMPQIFFLGGLAVALRRGQDTEKTTVLALSLLPLFWMAAHVQQNTHVVTMAVLSMIVFGTAWESRALPRRALGAAAVVHAFGLLVAPAISAYEMARGLPEAEGLGVPGTALVMVPRDTQLAFRPIANFVRQNVAEEEPIYVGLERHDATVISSPILYYVCDRPPAVRYHELHPGITDREDVQGDMLGDIESRGTRFAVLWRFGWPKSRLDGIRDRSRRAVPGAGSDRLDRWIALHFVRLEDHGEFGLYRVRE